METPPEDHAFAPAHEKLISVYLRHRIEREPLPAAASVHFHEADIYAADPATLTAGSSPAPARKGEGSSWFFFTPVRPRSSTDSRKSRAVGGGVGTWHSEHAALDVLDDDGNRVGYRQLFSYKPKGGARSEWSWSMWEYGGADQGGGHEGGESQFVLCKIHQARTRSRRTGAPASRSSSSSASARKRKGTDECVGQAYAPVRRRLFAPPAPTPPAASQDKISAASESILSPRSEAEPSNDTPRSVMSFWSEPDESLDKINAPLSSVLSCSPEPDASQVTCSAGMESHVSFLIPETTTFDWGSLMAGGNEANFMNGGGDVSGAPGARSVITSLSEPDVSLEKIGTMEDCFLMPELEASQGEAAAFDDWGFLMAGGGDDVSGMPLFGGLPTYDECGTGTSLSWTGCDAFASCFASNAVPRGLPTYDDEWLMAGSAGMSSACAMPSAPFLPCDGPDFWSF